MKQEQGIQRFELAIDTNIGSNVSPEELKSTVEAVLRNLGAWSLKASINTVTTKEEFEERLKTPLNLLMEGVDLKGLGKARNNLMKQVVRDARAMFAIGSAKLAGLDGLSGSVMQVIGQNLTQLCPNIQFYDKPPLGFIAAICGDSSNVPVQVILKDGRLCNMTLERWNSPLPGFTVADVLKRDPALMKFMVLGEDIESVFRKAVLFDRSLKKLNTDIARSAIRMKRMVTFS